MPFTAPKAATVYTGAESDLSGFGNDEDSTSTTNSSAPNDQSQNR